MTEALFRIGGVYRFKSGRVAEIRAPKESNLSTRLQFVGAVAEMFEPGTECRYSYVDLALGRHPHDLENGDWQLVPGELHNFDGQWLPITEQARSPYFAEAVESEWVSLGCTCGDHPADLAMIARDGPARPAAPVVIQEPAKTSHGPIAGLTVVAAVDHRFGGHAFHSA